MIELERHIEILLLSNDCVIVPELGGFMAHHVEARYDEGDSTFLPPLRTLGFNPKLTMNDSLLVQSYVEAYDLSYPEALRRIEEEVAELRQRLENEGSYEMNDIGVLALNGDGNLVFTPCEAGILTPALYGLSSFEMKTLAATEAKTMVETAVAKTEETSQEEPQETEAVEKPIYLTDEDDEEKAIVIKMSWVRNAVAIAAVVLAFFLMTTPVSNSDDSGRNIGQLHNAVLKGFTVKDTNMQRVIISNDADTIEVVDIAAAAPAPEQNDTLKAEMPQAQTAEESEAYTIVLASYITRKNADAFVEQLHKRGFNEAEVFIRNNVTRVILGNFDTENNAYNRLRSLCGNKDFEEAWVMEI